MPKINFNNMVLLIFFAIILFLGLGVLFDHKIKHDFPFAYGASDAFQHQTRTEAVKDAGNFRYEANYISMGLENIIGRYPPEVYHLAVILSHASGLETFDSIYFTVTFFTIIAAFVMYFIVRNFNKTVALISLPLTLIVFSFPVSIGFLWGHWPSIMAQSFLLLFFWSIMRIDLNKSYIIIAISLSAITLTHTSEAIFGLLFLALFFGHKLLVKKLNWKSVKIMIISLILFFVVSFYYIFIFRNTWAKGAPFTFATQAVWDGTPGFYIAGFGLLLVPMVLGMIFSLTRFKNLHVSFILAFAMLISGFLNYVGFELRSFQTRFFWPIYLSVFLGFGIYIVFKFIVKKWNFIYTSAILIVLIILLGGIIKLPILKQTDVQVIPSVPSLNRATGQGIMNPFHWEMLNWIDDNTETDATIYFFYGDIYSQDALLRNTKRIHYLVDPEDFVKAIQDRELRKEYNTEFAGDTGGGLYTRPSFFKFISATENMPDDFYVGYKNICNFDYYVVDKFSRQEVLAQYNLLIAQELLNNDYIIPVFENQIVIILKNNNLGADCIEERNF